MYNVSTDFLTAVRQPGRVFKSKVTVKKTGYADLNLTDAQIMSMKLSSSSISGEDFEIGTTCAAQLDIEIANLDGSLTTAAFQDAQILASIGVLLADGVTFEYCPLGVFYVDTPSRTDTSIKLTCYDAMVQLETLYQSTLTYPATLLQIAQDIAAKAGLTLASTTFPNASFSVSTAPSLAGVTLRSVLSWVAQASATFARINRDGKLELSFYTSTSTAITAASYFTLTHNDQPRAAITQVTIRQTDDDTGVSSGTAGNTYTITGNPLLASNPSGALTAIYNQLNGFSYMPFQSDWQGNPTCMVGDAIAITDRANNSYSTIFTECDLVYEGGVKGTASAKALSATGQNHQTPSAVSSAASTAVQAAQQASFDVAQINNLLAGNITAANIAASTITADKLKAGTITASSGVIANAAIGTANIQDAAIVGAKIASATITAANIANATITAAQIASAAIGTASIANGAITTALIGTGAVNTAQIADGSITDAKIVTLTANKLTAGTIDASKITVTNLNCANLTVGTINGTQIATGAITATQIADGTITSTELATAVNTSISNAQTTANNAASAAASAQTSANGKSSIYRQATQPSGGTYTAGDVWFDTGNGNRVYIYASGAWTLSQLGYQAISGIDAGTISTGTLSAARIAASTITADKLVIGDFNNMCTNPKFLNVSAPWTCSRVADPAVNSTAAPTAYVANTSARDNYEAAFQVTPGDAYYCSLTGIPSGANFPLTVGLYFKDKSGAAITWTSCGASIPTSATVWTTISGTVTVPANAVTAQVWVQISNSSTITGVWYFTNVIVNRVAGSTMIGSGAVMTDKLAANAVTAAKIAANTITASQIAAGTITATQISAATITGDKLVADTITAREIASAVITSNEIAANTIMAGNIAAGTITATQIASATITGGNIAGTTITGSNISAGTITGDKIAANTITASNIDVTNLSVYKVQAQSDSTAYLTMTSAGMSLYRGSNLSLTITADSGSNYASIIPKGTYNGLWLGTDSASNNSANGLWVTASGCFFYSGSWGQISLGYGNWVTFTTSGGTVYYLGGSSGQRWTTVPVVDPNGVMEVGQYIDFHESSGDTSDYSSRLYSSGGTITTMGNFSCKGQLSLPGSTYPQIIGNGSILQINLDSTSSANGIVISGGTVRPPGDAQVNLGGSGHRWATVYAASGTINTSDRNEKNTITSLDTERASAFIVALNPVSFKYNDGTSGRTHYGMISQDVEDAMTSLGMSSLDFAGFIKSPKITEEIGEDADGNPIMTETPIPGEYHYGLRYEEFISPLIKTVQGLLARCAELERIIKNV